jgi:glycosyltransferase involved in cell wall biosynthesis
MEIVLKRFPKAILHIKCAVYPSEDSHQEHELCMREIDRLHMKESVIIDTSFLDKAEILTELKKSDIAVLPYEKSNEGGSATATDCFAVGLPLIVSDAEIFSEICEYTVTTKANVQDIADAILRILSDTKTYDLYAERSFSYASANSWNSIAGAFLVRN